MAIILDGDLGETLPGNLTFTGTSNRMLADFTNATLSNRAMFQTSTANGGTSVGFIPNGTATISNSNWFTSSDPNNSSYGQIAVIAGTEIRFFSGFTGTGTYLPMKFYNYNTERMRIEEDAPARIKTTGSVYNPRVSLTGTSGTIDLTLGNNFTIAVAAPITLSFTNPKDCQTGTIVFNNTGGYAISKDGSVGADANFLATISAPGYYLIGYSSGASTTRVSYTQNTA